MGSIAEIAARLSGAGSAADHAAPVFPEMLNIVLAAACQFMAAPAKAVLVSADHAAAIFRTEKAGTNARIAARSLKKTDSRHNKGVRAGILRRLYYSNT